MNIGELLALPQKVADEIKSQQEQQGQELATRIVSRLRGQEVKSTTAEDFEQDGPEPPCGSGGGWGRNGW